MSLAGRGAVAIWHDIADEGRDAFYAWHGREHMPERTGIPGFLRGRRYVAESGTPEFFNLYETMSPHTVTGPDYLARLNDPTAWTIATLRHFRSVSRSLCSVAASFGEGQGGLMATFRYVIDETGAEPHIRTMSQQTLPVWAAEPGIAGCHLLVADEAASKVETEEKRARAEQNLVPRWIVLLEGWGDLPAFRGACSRFEREALGAASGSPLLGIYRLQNSRGAFAWSAG